MSGDVADRETDAGDGVVAGVFVWKVDLLAGST